MDDMQERIGTILNNPQMMQQIMAMAQALGSSNDAQPKQNPPPVRQDPPAPALPEIDFAMVQKLSSLAGQSGIDRDQQALLKALSPYLCRERISKLEKAMRAAKMARLASAFLGQGGIPFLTGR